MNATGEVLLAGRAAAWVHGVHARDLARRVDNARTTDRYHDLHA